MTFDALAYEAAEDRAWERQRPEIDVLPDREAQARRVRELVRQNRPTDVAAKVERLHREWGVSAGRTTTTPLPKIISECWFCELPAGRRNIAHDKMHGHDCPAKGDDDCECYPAVKKPATGSGRPLTEHEAAVLDLAREGRQDGVNEANEAARDGLVRFAATASPMATMQAMFAYSGAHRMAGEQGQDAYHANREGNRAALAAWKAANGCVNHPEVDDAAALELDHRDPVEKARQDDRGDRRGAVLIDWKHERFMQELSKCDVLCKPCHRNKTRRERAEVEELLLTNHEAKKHHIGERIVRRAKRRTQDEELLVALWEAWPDTEGDWLWWAPTGAILNCLTLHDPERWGELDGRRLGQAIQQSAKRLAPSGQVPKSTQQPGGTRDRGWSRDVLQPLWDALVG